MTTGCTDQNMTGCGGLLCAACRPMLRQYTLRRFPADQNGMPMLDGTPEEFRLCGLAASVPRAVKSDEKLEIPGKKSGGSSGIRITVAAFSGGYVRKHDRVSVDGEDYRVTVVRSTSPAVAVLVPA